MAGGVLQSREGQQRMIHPKAQNKRTNARINRANAHSHATIVPHSSISTSRVWVIGILPNCSRISILLTRSLWSHPPVISYAVFVSWNYISGNVFKTFNALLLFTANNLVPIFFIMNSFVIFVLLFTSLSKFDALLASIHRSLFILFCLLLFGDEIMSSWLALFLHRGFEVFLSGVDAYLSTVHF